MLKALWNGAGKVRRWEKGDQVNQVLRGAKKALAVARERLQVPPSPLDLDDVKMLQGRLLALQLADRPPPRMLEEVEFKVFSQFGDDGILQYLVHNVEIPEKTFIEFGVENYLESNTRFLLEKDNWSGLVMDGSPENVKAIQQGRFYWRHELQAVAAFIDRDNINGLLKASGLGPHLGILSIDIDGNDYWVWEAIQVVDPVIVVVEYNSVFGARHAITVPYDPSFRRTTAHSSNLYWGVSVRALCHVAARKGYAFVGCNSAGNNAYFVKRGSLGRLREHSPESGYVRSRFRESRNPDGSLSYLTGDARLAAIREMMVHDVEKNRTVRISDLDSQPGE